MSQFLGYFPLGSVIAIDLDTVGFDASPISPTEALDSTTIKIRRTVHGESFTSQEYSDWDVWPAVRSEKNVVTGYHFLEIDTSVEGYEEPSFFVEGHFFAWSELTIDGQFTAKGICNFILGPPPWIGEPAGASVSADIAAIPTAQGIWEYATRTLSDIDGITFISVMEAILAAVSGVAEPSGNTVIFKKRDGETAKLTITYGTEDGERTASTINS
ncbi:MAG TPA: hypothetical protein VMY42_06535 [Thermoguttaceae bacterium]|nr:hypothetical protein [Thermoguttaceae bacterium]